MSSLYGVLYSDMLPISVEVALISIALSFLLVLLSKILTNQAEIKRIRKETDEYRKKIKEAQKEKNEALVKDYTSKMFKLSQSQFKYSTRSMMVSMVVVVIAFGWLGATYGNLSIDLAHGDGPDSANFIGNINGQILVVYKSAGVVGLDSDKNSLIEDTEKYKLEDPVPYKGGYLKFQKPMTELASQQKNDASPELVKDKITAEIIAAKAPFTIPYAGTSLTWFWLYIFITLPTTFIFRKLLDVQ
ncbi:MAG: DUF106 domain-containing protein [Candidatus Aenigmarchaeota archaeon]|nr:DUF106 domain-containing protein [Candidatus Aenigmarchaeota archaeon]